MPPAWCRRASTTMPSAGPDLGTLQRPRNVEGAALCCRMAGVVLQEEAAVLVQKVAVVVAQPRTRSRHQHQRGHDFGRLSTSSSRRRRRSRLTRAVNTATTATIVPPGRCRRAAATMPSGTLQRPRNAEGVAVVLLEAGAVLQEVAPVLVQKAAVVVAQEAPPSIGV